MLNSTALFGPEFSILTEYLGLCVFYESYIWKR